MSQEASQKILEVESLEGGDNENGRKFLKYVDRIAFKNFIVAYGCNSKSRGRSI